MLSVKNSFKLLKNCHQVCTISSRKQKRKGLFPIYFKHEYYLDMAVVSPRYDNHRESTKKLKTNSQNYRSTSLINIDTKMFNKATPRGVHWCIKRIIHYGQVGGVRDVQLAQH